MACSVLTRTVLAFSLAFAISLSAAAQAPARSPSRPRTNPMAGDKKAIEQGKHLYRGRCAICHGLDARGYRANDLTSSPRTLTSTDEQLYRLISRGIPGTEMPASTMHDDEIWMVIAYVRTLADPSAGKEWPGNAARGEQLFWSVAKGNCGLCHMVGARGGRLGPNLSRIGMARSRTALVREIRRPSEYIPVGYETVTVTMKDGKRVIGARKNEDTFSVQLMTAAGDIFSFMKRDVQEVVEDPKSLMPEYGAERLTDSELDDLVRYLGTLKGAATPVPSSNH
jgi:putative heme-binding domain-containing protein